MIKKLSLALIIAIIFTAIPVFSVDVNAVTEETIIQKTGFTSTKIMQMIQILCTKAYALAVIKHKTCIL